MHDKVGVVDCDGGVWGESFTEVHYAEGRGEVEVVGGGGEEGDFDVGVGFFGGVERGGGGEVGGGCFVFGIEFVVAMEEAGEAGGLREIGRGGFISTEEGEEGEFGWLGG